MASGGETFRSGRRGPRPLLALVALAALGLLAGVAAGCGGRSQTAATVTVTAASETTAAQTTGTIQSEPATTETEPETGTAETGPETGTIETEPGTTGASATEPDPASSDPATVLMECLTEAGAEVEDERADLDSIAVSFPGIDRGLLSLSFEEDMSNAEWTAMIELTSTISDAVYLGEGIFEAWLFAPTDEDLDAMDDCYFQAGITPPDRSGAPPAVGAEPSPAASVTSLCDYLLGDYSENTKSGYRLVADADVENTGNVGIVVAGVPQLPSG